MRVFPKKVLPVQKFKFFQKTFISGVVSEEDELPRLETQQVNNWNPHQASKSQPEIKWNYADALVRTIYPSSQILSKLCSRLKTKLPVSNFTFSFFFALQSSRRAVFIRFSCAELIAAVEILQMPWIVRMPGKSSTPWFQARKLLLHFTYPFFCFSTSNSE